MRRFFTYFSQGYGHTYEKDFDPDRWIKIIEEGKIFLSSAVSQTVLQDLIKSEKESSRSPTRRQLEIIRLLAEGKENKEVAAALGITLRTVESHRAQIMLRLGLHSLTELVHYAIRNKIV